MEKYLTNYVKNLQFLRFRLFRSLSQVQVGNGIINDKLFPRVRLSKQRISLVAFKKKKLIILSQKIHKIDIMRNYLKEIVIMRISIR